MSYSIHAEAEGYLALAISILAFKSVDEAFYALSLEEIKWEWTDEIMHDIELMRQEGMSWSLISESLGKKNSTTRKAYSKWRSKK